jgi:predicted transposase YbfD/YdcC
VAYVSGSDLSNNLNCYIFWPFLSATTKDPQNNITLRWKEDGKLHVFLDTLATPSKFQQWFQDEILQNGKSMDGDNWNLLLRRYYKLHVQ